MNNYYKDLDLKYLEKAICLEKFDIHNPGLLKFYVPALMPFIKQDKPTTNNVRVSKTHLMNKYSNEIIASNCSISNYIEIELPDYITAIVKDISISVSAQCSGGEAPEGGGQCSPGTITTNVESKKSYFLPTDENDIVPEGQEFIVAFIGGDFNNKKIIGRYK